jgi:purine-nucleoside phosphorylase
MSLLITPTLNPKVIVNYFNAKPIPEANFWPSNFKSYEDVPLIANNSFKAKVGSYDLFILHVGYGEQGIEYGIDEYERILREKDKLQEIYFIGSCYATKQSKLNVGDIVVPYKSEVGGEHTKFYAQKLLERNVKEPTKFDEKLIERVKKIAERNEIKIHFGKIFSAPIDKGYPWDEFHETGHEKGYLAAELESACVAVLANYFNIPAVAILRVKDTGKPDKSWSKDKRYQAYPSEYKVLPEEEKRKVLTTQLKLVEASIKEA